MTWALFPLYGSLTSSIKSVIYHKKVQFRPLSARVCTSSKVRLTWKTENVCTGGYSGFSTGKHRQEYWQRLTFLTPVYITLTSVSLCQCTVIKFFAILLPREIFQRYSQNERNILVWSLFMNCLIVLIFICIMHYFLYFRLFVADHWCFYLPLFYYFRAGVGKNPYFLSSRYGLSWKFAFESQTHSGYVFTIAIR